MSTTPYAALQVSVNGGGAQTGGLEIAAGASVQLSAVSTVGWTSPAARWEISTYPVGFACPGGWTADANGTYYVLSNSPPPSFTVDASLWGKYGLRLFVNGGRKDGRDSTDLEDTSAWLSVLSFSGLRDVGSGESNQFSAARTWIGDIQKNLRVIDAGLPGGSVQVKPKGGGADDSASLNATIAAAAAAGKAVQFLPGTYTIQNPLLLSTGATVLGAPGKTILNAAITPGAGAVFQYDGYNSRSVQTTLSAAVIVGSYALALTAIGSIVVGSQLVLTSTTQWVSVYTVVGVSAAWQATHAYAKGALVTNSGKAYLCITAGTSAGAGGPTTTASDITDGTVHWKHIGTAGAAVLVERPILKSFEATSEVATTTFAKNVTIRGFTFTGSADFAMEAIGGAIDWVTEDCTFDGSWVHWCHNYDFGSLRCVGRRLRTTKANAPISWWCGLESAESCSYEDCHGQSQYATPGQYGFWINSCVDCHIIASSFHGAEVGITLGTQDNFLGTGAPCLDCSIVSCDFSDSTSQGITVVDGAVGCRLVGVTARRCGSSGVQMTAANTSIDPVGLVLLGCDVRGSAVGVQINGGAGHRLNDIKADGCGNAVVAGTSRALTDLQITGLNADDCTSVAILLQNGSATTGTKIERASIRRSTQQGIQISSGVQDTLITGCYFEDCAITSAGNAQIDFAGRVRVIDTDLKWTVGPGVANFGISTVVANADVTVRGVSFNMPKTGAVLFLAMVSQAASTIFRVSNTRVIDGAGAGAGNRTFYYGSAANYFIRGSDVDSSVPETLYNLSGGAQTNVGTFTVNGATPVDVSWGLTQPSTKVRIKRKTAGGTAGAEPTYTRTNATKVSFTGTAADTSVYDYELDGA